MKKDGIGERLRQPPKHNIYSKTPVTLSLKGNEKQLELARIRVVGVNVREILMKGKEFFFELARNSSYPSSSSGFYCILKQQLIFT